MYRLREIKKEDISIINEWRSKIELIDNLGAPFRYINLEVDLKWYESYIASREKNIRCSIINEDEVLIGLISLTNIDRFNQSAILHLMIGDKKFRGKGAGYFAIKEILNHAFEDINLQRIELNVLKSNEVAIKLYKKVGFIREGVKRNAVYKKGRFEDMNIMSILKNEFKK